MLLQTNSYIVPRERRAEHARLIRRFRQALARIGCDQFEVYEQVGANWSPGGANGRYVQIMRFRDRQHQQAVQAAERNDPGAQQIIAEFCDLINFPYQQQHGYFATGFYASVLPTGPRQSVDLEVEDEEEAPVVGAAATIDPFAERAAASIDSGADDLQVGADIPFDNANEQAEEDRTPPEPARRGEDEKDLVEAEKAALNADTAVETGKPAMLPGAHPGEQDDELFETAEIAALDDLHLGESDLPTEAHADPQPLHAASDHSHEEHEDPTQHETIAHEPPAGEFDLETEEFGLLFEDELPGDQPVSAGSDATGSHATAGPEFESSDPAPGAFVRRVPPPVRGAAANPPQGEHHEPHEELLPPILDSYGSDRGAMNGHEPMSDEAGLDALLDDANLLDNVPFSDAGDADAPRLHSRREPAGKDHDVPGETETELLESEARFRELEEDPSTDHGHLR